jgi:hypothetical protein
MEARWIRITLLYERREPYYFGNKKLKKRMFGKEFKKSF